MTHRKEAVARGSSGFAGDLEALSVADLIQTLALGARTARVTLSCGERQGEMWFVAGTLVHAEAAPHFGEPAAYEMLGWSAGRFSAQYGAETEARSIVQDTTYVVLEGLRRIDERSGSDPDGGYRTPETPPPEANRRRAFTLLFLGLVALAGTLGVVILTMAQESPTGISTDPAGPMATFELAIPPAPPPAAAPSASKTRARIRSAPAPVRPEPVPLGIVSVAESLPPVGTELDWPDAPPPPQVSLLRLRVKSRVAGGSLSIVVDDREVFVRDLVRKGEEFEAVATVPPGDHEILTRVHDPDRGGWTEETVRGSFVANEEIDLRVTAGRRFGSPVKVRLDASGGDSEDN